MLSLMTHCGATMRSDLMNSNLSVLLAGTVAAATRVPRSLETPNPLGPPWVPGHRATVGSYGGGGSYERGTPVVQLRAVR